MTEQQKPGAIMINMMVLTVIVCSFGWWGCSRFRAEPSSSAQSTQDVTESVESVAEILLEDDYKSLWQVIENDFTLPEDNPDKMARYSGILFQFGDYLNERGDPGITAPKLQIYYLDPETQLEVEKPIELSVENKNFSWLNLVPMSAGGSATKFSKWSYLLYPDTKTPKDLVACGEGGEGDPCSAKDCMRLRSLRTHYTPKAIMTYWADSNGYDLSVTYAGEDKETGLGKDKRSAIFRFSLNDPVRLIAWKFTGDGSDPEQPRYDISNITRIRVFHSDTTHGEIHWPPIGDGTAILVPGSGDGSGDTIEPLP